MLDLPDEPFDPLLVDPLLPLEDPPPEDPFDAFPPDELVLDELVLPDELLLDELLLGELLFDDPLLEDPLPDTPPGPPEAADVPEAPLGALSPLPFDSDDEPPPLSLFEPSLAAGFGPLLAWAFLP